MKMTLGEFVEMKKQGMFEEYDVQKDPSFVRQQIRRTFD